MKGHLVTKQYEKWSERLISLKRAYFHARTKTNKYLYVLMPEDKQLDENVNFWKGRIPTIKEDVQNIVMESQNQMSQHTSEMFKTLMDEIKGFSEDLTSFKDDINGLKEQVRTLEQRVNEQNSNRFFC